MLFHATKHFEVKKWVRLKKKREDVTYPALLQYAKEHEMMAKDFNHHKSNRGITQLTSIDAIKTFKRGKKSSGNGSSHRASGLSNKDSKTCSKYKMTHSCKDCPTFGKKCHKCSFKNHFSSCCRSTQNVGQGQGCWRGRIPAHSRSTERCH